MGSEQGSSFEITQSANGLVWKDPPTARSYRARTDYTAVVAELRANPGRWALIFENASAGMSSTLKRRGLQTRTVQVSAKPNRHDVYARWPEGADYDR